MFISMVISETTFGSFSYDLVGRISSLKTVSSSISVMSSKSIFLSYKRSRFFVTLKGVVSLTYVLTIVYMEIDSSIIDCRPIF